MKRLIPFGLVFTLMLFGYCRADPPELPGPTTGQPSVNLVDPEMLESIAPEPVQVPQPPPEVHLPEVIVSDRQWRGVQCGVTEERFAVFQHLDKWEIFWQKGIAPYSKRLEKIPVVDFSKDMVVGVFMGEKLDPHYEIEIRSIKREIQPGGDPALIVRYREIHKMTGVFTPEFAIQPFHLMRVTLFDGPVLFQKVKR